MKTMKPFPMKLTKIMRPSLWFMLALGYAIIATFAGYHAYEARQMSIATDRYR